MQIRNASTACQPSDWMSTCGIWLLNSFEPVPRYTYLTKLEHAQLHCLSAMRSQQDMHLKTIRIAPTVDCIQVGSIDMKVAWPKSVMKAQHQQTQKDCLVICDSKIICDKKLTWYSNSMVTCESILNSLVLQ